MVVILLQRRTAPMRRSFRHLILTLGLSAALYSNGCAAPTLPLPPPTALVEAPDPQGLVLVTGDSSAEAYIFVLNEDQDAGVIGRADLGGRYEVRLRGEPGDTLTVWQMVGSDRGTPIQRQVPAP